MSGDIARNTVGVVIKLEVLAVNVFKDVSVDFV